jgi:SNF2 family DNA or RNA helicase
MFPFKTKPMAHQLKAFEMEKPADASCFAYLAEMGTGKSKMLLDDLFKQALDGKIQSAVIVTYKGVYMNWVNSEIPKHWNEEAVPCGVMYWNNGKVQGEYKKGQFNFLVVNVESLSSKKIDGSYVWIKKLLTISDCAFVIDESTCIKNIKSQRTENIINLSKLAKQRRILTGTPITNSPLDLYSQFSFLSKNILGFTSYYAFKSYVAVEVQVQMEPDPVTGRERSYKKIVSYNQQALDYIAMRIKPFSFKITKDECLDLPLKVYQTYEVELSPEQKKAYNEMKQSLLVRSGEEIVCSVQAVIAQLTKLQQIISGYVYDNETMIEHKIPGTNPRLAALINLTDGCDKAIIWGKFRFDIKLLVDALQKEYGKESVVSYYGDTTVEERQRAIELFQDPSSGVRFFVGNPATAGFGLTLTAATTVIYYSNSYDIERRQQSEDRAHRIGQTKSVTYVDIIAKNTIDTKIIESLKEKKNIQNLVLKEGWEKFI